MTKEQAIALYDTEWWKSVSDETIVRFQLYEPLLCMPFDIFQEKVEKVLGRPVFTHEFAYPDLLKKELRGEKRAPTIDEIFAMLPAKQVLVVGLEKTHVDN